MKQIHAIFFDIDGTLLKLKSNRIDEITLKAISKAQQNGYKVAIASSRPLTTINDIENIWDIQWDGIVAGSGTMIYDKNMNVLKNHTLPKNTLAKIFQIAKENNIAMYTCGKESFFTEWNDLTKWLKETYHVKSNLVHPYKNETVQLLTLLSEDRNQIYELYKNIKDIRVVRSGPYNNDIFPANINKCTGIHELMEKWNFNLQDYMCFGDTQGDHDMILDSNIGIAMASGMKETKKIADYVCHDIYDGLKYYKVI